MHIKSQQSVALRTAVDKLCSTYFAAIEADRLSVEQTLGTYVLALPSLSFLSSTAYQLLFSVFLYIVCMPVPIYTVTAIATPLCMIGRHRSA